MLAALVIVFREVLEAGLIIGVVLAASRGVEGRGRAVGLGIAAGVVGSIVVAAFAGEISTAFDGRGQELFIAAVLLLAVVMLTWHVVWMKEHARELTLRLRKLGQAVAAGSESVLILGIATAMAVLREGSEVVLFLTGLLLQGSDALPALLVGSIGGLALGAAVSAIVYLGLSAIPLRRLFDVTGAIVMLLAAGLAAQAMRQLSSAGLFAGSFDTTLWDTSWLLSEDSALGRVLHVLVGYMDRPSLIEGIAYFTTVTLILLLSLLVSLKRHDNAFASRPR